MIIILGINLIIYSSRIEHIISNQDKHITSGINCIRCCIRVHVMVDISVVSHVVDV
jgi:hypothetical protein